MIFEIRNSNVTAVGQISGLISLLRRCEAKSLMCNTGLNEGEAIISHTEEKA